jgi:hypothetical protein
MACSLHTLIEENKKGKVGVATNTVNCNPDRPRKASNVILSHSSNAVAFYAGEIENIECLAPLPGMLMLPFNECWFEFDIADTSIYTKMGCIAAQSGDDLQMHFYVLNRSWSYFGSGFNISETNDGGIKFVGYEECPDVIKLIWTIKQYLSALNCINISRQEHKPDAALQKARQKRGKQPLFSYWTLNVDLERGPSSSEQRGGTHASPRVHLRRGHARLLSVGRYVWVQPCVVGSKAAGVVHKEYASA